VGGFGGGLLAVLHPSVIPLPAVQLLRGGLLQGLVAEHVLQLHGRQPQPRALLRPLLLLPARRRPGEHTVWGDPAPPGGTPCSAPLLPSLGAARSLEPPPPQESEPTAGKVGDPPCCSPGTGSPGRVRVSCGVGGLQAGTFPTLTHPPAWVLSLFGGVEGAWHWDTGLGTPRVGWAQRKGMR